jgi:hypothetical protein
LVVGGSPLTRWTRELPPSWIRLTILAAVRLVTPVGRPISCTADWASSLNPRIWTANPEISVGYSRAMDFASSTAEDNVSRAHECWSANVRCGTDRRRRGTCSETPQEPRSEVRKPAEAPIDVAAAIRSRTTTRLGCRLGTARTFAPGVRLLSGPHRARRSRTASSLVCGRYSLFSASPESARRDTGQNRAGLGAHSDKRQRPRLDFRDQAAAVPFGAIRQFTKVRSGSMLSKKGFSGVALTVRARKGFRDLLAGRNGDSPSVGYRNWILSNHHIFSSKSDFFDSIGQTR